MSDPAARPGDPRANGRDTPRPRGAWEIPLAVALAAATIWTACFCFPTAWTITGIGEPDKPFLDLRGLISAFDTLRLGGNPYVSNPLDPYHRVFVYSDWWLALGRLGITGDDLAWVGVLLLLTFLAAAVLLNRPSTGREGRDLLLVLVSPALLMAVHRANNDLVAFVLMAIALSWLRGKHPLPRALAILLLALSAALKYFPLAAAVLLLEARTRRELVGWIALYGAVLLLAWPGMQRGLGFAAAHAPAPAGLYAFGAPMIFRNLNLEGAAGLGRLTAAGLLAVGAFRWWPRSERTTGETASASPEFMCGATMVIGCFVQGSSFAYKLVFALWLLPALWAPSGSIAEDRWRQGTRSLLLAVLWFEGLATTLFNIVAMNFPVPVATGSFVLQGILLVGQLLAWALCVMLWRPMVIHLAGQWRRWRATMA